MAFPPQGTSGKDVYTIGTPFSTLHDGYAYLDGGDGFDQIFLTSGAAGTYGDTIWNGVSHFELLMLFGGSWSFTLGYAAAKAFDGNITINAFPADSVLIDGSGIGTGAQLTVYATAAADTVIGGDSSNFIVGNGGADVLVGGKGYDAFFFQNAQQLQEAAKVDGGGGGNSIVFLCDTTLGDQQLANASHIGTLNFQGGGAQSAVLGAKAEAMAPGAVTVFAPNAASLHIDASAFSAKTALVGYAGNGPATFEGGQGNDWLVGGCGTDTFVERHMAGHDTIVNFAVGAGDVVDFKGFSQADVASILAGAVDYGNGTLLSWDHGASTAFLWLVAKSALTMADFAWG